MTNRVVIRKHHRIIDVFHGEEGWEENNWTRFLLVGNYLKFIKGAQMSPKDFNSVKKELAL
jgi:hypothetical protein